MPEDHKPKPHYYVYFAIAWVAVMMAVSLQPGSITGYIISKDMPDNFAPSYNVMKNEVSLEAEGTVSGRAAEITVRARNDYIYKTFYVWVDNEWRRFDFDATEEWIRGEAEKTVIVDADKIGGGRVAAYTCTWNGRMRCGCLSEMDCGYWQLQEFEMQY